MANLFGTLNRFISRLDSEPGTPKPSGAGGYGFQVLRNKNIDLAIEPWFDFIIGINGRTIDNPEPSLFSQEVRNCAGSTISLGVYSAKGQHIREIYVPIPPDTASLGLALQWSPLSSTDNVWHILDVSPDSPADNAGLLPYSDYVIGSPEGLMRGDSGLGELIEDFLNRPLRLFVYNNEYDVTRIVTITPTRGWGGDGALGCVLGFGALHRVPLALNEPTQAPGETLFESARFSNEEARPSSTAPPSAGFQTTGTPTPSDFLVPANMQFSAAAPSAPPLVGAPPKSGKKARAHHNISPGASMDEYFKEGEQKSREHDHGSTPKPSAAGLPPPPPKAGGGGGPPRAVKSPVEAVEAEAEAEAPGEES